MDNTQTKKPRFIVLWAGLALFLALIAVLFATDQPLVAAGGIALLALSAPLVAFWRRAKTGIVGPELKDEPAPRHS